MSVAGISAPQAAALDPTAPILVKRRRARLWGLFSRLPALIGLAVLLLVTLIAIFAPVVVPHDPYLQSLEARLLPPGTSDVRGFHVLGTDQLGRDLLSRLIYGAQVSLLVGVTVVLIAGTVGIALGIIAGYYGGLIDEIVMRLADLRLALPFILLVIAVIAVFGPSLFNLIVILGLTSWVSYARVVRAEVLSIRERDFVTAARALGAQDNRLMFRHILPNTVASALVIGSLELANLIVLESSLSFLGLGIQPPTPSWGNMLGEGRDYLLSNWWLATWPGCAIAITAVSVNLVGDRLRDILDPHLQT